MSKFKCILYLSFDFKRFEVKVYYGTSYGLKRPYNILDALETLTVNLGSITFFRFLKVKKKAFGIEIG